MRHEKLEAALKLELGRIDTKLKEAQNLHSAAWIGTGLAMGLFLATMTSQVPLVIAMAAAGALLNLATTRIITPKK
jgi:hypothetical protein